MKNINNHSTQNKNHFLSAFEGKNTRIPVWLMRQAGRYLPQYRKVKENHSLMEMFSTPEVAAEITLQPIDILGVDAAILFADILTLPSAMGFEIDFVKGKGPVIANPLKKWNDDIGRIHDTDGVGYVEKTIQLVKENLPSYVPLIGFAGSPFTVLNYLVEHKRSLGPIPALRLAYENPDFYHAMMKKLTLNSIKYVQKQRDAGIDAFQLFDTWAGHLRPVDFEQLVLPYVKQIFETISFPSIYYVKHCAHLLNIIQTIDVDYLSVCETVTIGENLILNQINKGVQGNFFNALLYCDEDIIQQELSHLLNAAKQHHSKYIFNLSHGMLPDMDVEKVKFLVQYVQEFNWNSADD